MMGTSVMCSLSEVADPLGLWVPWMKTKVQGFGDILDAMIEGDL